MNKELITKALLLTSGALIGSVVTWGVVRTKYEKLIEDKNEEIAFLRDRYSVKKDNVRNTEEEVGESESDSGELTVQQVRDKITELGYKNEEEDEDDMNGPKVIAPEESWEQDYPVISLTYYEGDGVLADERGKIIKNVDELVGEDFADHFGEYEDDSVFIRNDKLKIYYEILKDYGSYSESE